MADGVNILDASEATVEIATDDALYVETAYGEGFYARILKPSWTRAGTLSAPRRPASIEYAEVGRPVVN